MLIASAIAATSLPDLMLRRHRERQTHIPSGILCSVTAETNSVVFFQFVLSPSAVSLPDADAEADGLNHTGTRRLPQPSAAGNQPTKPIASPR
ncbi:MAG: hypothetical protein ACLVJ6_07665 [Merdibacter sp.]